MSICTAEYYNTKTDIYCWRRFSTFSYSYSIEACWVTPVLINDEVQSKQPVNIWFNNLFFLCKCLNCVFVCKQYVNMIFILLMLLFSIRLLH